MLRKTFFTLLLISSSFILSMNAFAQVPHLINYQGMLTDASDSPLDGNFTIVFRIYNSSAGGTSVWQETQSVSVANGIFNVLLGSTSPLTTSIFDGSNKYLSLKVGSDPEMAQRKRLVSVGYSLQSEKADEAGDADKLDGFHASSFVRTVDGTMPNSNGNVDLEGGTDISIGPGLTPNSIRISYTGTSPGDNLGNHTATQNIKLGSYWLSSDGGNEGIQVNTIGDVSCSRKLLVGSPSSSSGAGDIVADDDVIADGWVQGNAFHAQGDIFSDNGYIRAGSPSTISVGAGDIGATDDLIADDDVYVGDELRVRGHAIINSSSNPSGTHALYVLGSVFAVNGYFSSDIKFKKDIVNVQNPLSTLTKLRGVKYNWRTSEYVDRELPEGEHYGLIAQEVEQVLPEVVKTDENGEKAIAYTEIIPILIEAIKQQQQMILELKTQIDQLIKK